MTRDSISAAAWGINVHITCNEMKLRFERVPKFDAPVYGELLVPRGILNSKLLKSKFNAENFIRRLSPTISNRMCTAAIKSQKSLKSHNFGGSRSFTIIDIGTF